MRSVTTWPARRPRRSGAPVVHELGDLGRELAQDRVRAVVGGEDERDPARRVPGGDPQPRRLGEAGRELGVTVERDLRQPVRDARVRPALGELRAVGADVDAGDLGQGRHEILGRQPLRHGHQRRLRPRVGDRDRAQSRPQVGQQRVGAVEQPQLERLVRRAGRDEQGVPVRPRAIEVLDHPLPERLGDNDPWIIGSRHDAVDHRARVAMPGVTHDPCQHLAVAREVVEREHRGRRRAARQALTQQRDHRRIGAVGLLGHGQRDDLGRRQRVEHRLPLRRRVQRAREHSQLAARVVRVPDDQRVAVPARAQRVDDRPAARGHAPDLPATSVGGVLAEVRASEPTEPT